MRSRLIKPGLFQNEKLAQLGYPVMLLFSGLWLMADRQGRLKDQPRWIRGQLFSLMDEQPPVDEWLTQLADAGFILRYVADDGEAYIQVINFLKHQNPHKNEAASVIPPPPGSLAPMDGEARSNGESTRSNGGSTRAVTVSDPVIDPVSNTGDGEPDSLPGGSPPGRTHPSGTGLDLAWDFTLEVYRTNIASRTGKPLDPGARGQLKSFHDQLGADWVRAAINEASVKPDTGFGLVKAILERCAEENQPPASLRKSRGRSRNGVHA